MKFVRRRDSSTYLICLAFLRDFKQLIILQQEGIIRLNFTQTLTVHRYTDSVHGAKLVIFKLSKICIHEKERQTKVCRRGTVCPLSHDFLSMIKPIVIFSFRQLLMSLVPSMG